MICLKFARAIGVYAQDILMFVAWTNLINDVLKETGKSQENETENRESRPIMVVGLLQRFLNCPWFCSSSNGCFYF